MSHPPVVGQDFVEPKLRNLVGNLRLIHILPWLRELTLEEVVMWWLWANGKTEDK